MTQIAPTDDYKNFRAARPAWPWAFAIIAAIAAGIVGPMHFAAELERDAELKVLRALHAKRPQAELAPIRPIRACRGKPFVALQADGGRWRISCAPSADLREHR